MLKSFSTVFVATILGLASSPAADAGGCSCGSSCSCMNMQGMTMPGMEGAPAGKGGPVGQMDMKNMNMMNGTPNSHGPGSNVLTDAAQSGKKPAPSADSTHATFLLTGLHCPPCTTTVESSLQSVNGIHSVKVDWNTKSARLDFDESVLPAQRLAQAIAGTPHMMGGDMHYSGWLALRVPELKDASSAKQVTDVLTKMPGVSRVQPYVAQHAVGIQFDAKGKLQSRELIDALAKAGVKAANY